MLQKVHSNLHIPGFMRMASQYNSFLPNSFSYTKWSDS